MTDNFAENLRRIRNEKGFSQQQLAKKMFVDRSSIARWENGSRIPDVILVSRLAECLGVETSQLLPDPAAVKQTPVIIVVDDEKVILSGTLRLLFDLFPGVEIMGFSKPSQALDFALRNQISIAFLDIEMGKTSGLDLCEELLKINDRTNVVFLTAWPDYSLQAWHTGACGFLIKPLQRKDVLGILPKLKNKVDGLPENRNND